MKQSRSSKRNRAAEFSRSRTPNNHQRCQFCGCTEAKPCAGGCAWADEETCTRCARTFHSGELHVLAQLAESIEAIPTPAVPKAALLTLLAGAGEERAHFIARLSADWPDAYAPADECEFGKGTRSSDRMAAGAGV